MGSASHGSQSLGPLAGQDSARPHASDDLCKGAVSAISPAVGLRRCGGLFLRDTLVKLDSPSPSPAEPKLDSLCLLPSPTQTTLPVDDLPSPEVAEGQARASSGGASLASGECS